MNEQELWSKFKKDGRLEDYLEYRRHLEMNAAMDLGRNDEVQHLGFGDTDNRHRGV
ncbi:MAG TPA: hypothetical protein VFC76_07060 [Oscillospiraceae bacterium]|nr:hypothetical protein [Oscillospiraceae bacterium]